MEDLEKMREEVVTEFIVGTCQFLPKSYDAVSEPIYFANQYIIYCGSTMEFYIRPLHSCVNDVDFLILHGNYLAFEEDFPVLPKDVSHLHDTITCLKIEPYRRYPGFVRLRKLGEMNYNWKFKTYEYSYEREIKYIIRSKITAKMIAQQMTLQNFSEPTSILRGPAITLQNSAPAGPSDNVRSLWCPQWPNEAQEWPKRPRNHGWPTIGTISEVVQQGCHLVYAQHRACRDDELQWRLSFSVAEVILLQSWTQIQQIVYHMLRFFATRELIQKDCPKEDEVLCSYHLKTLMLWTCEEMSSEWWNSSSVIASCCELLEKLSEWLKRRHCPNYFIPEANLFHGSFKSAMLQKIERQLKTFCKSAILCEWFLLNYVVSIFPKLKRKMDFSICLLLLTEFRNRLQTESLESLFSLSCFNCNIYTRRSINSQSTQRRPRSVCNYMRALKSINLLSGRMSKLQMPADVSCFTCIDKVVYCLNTAYSFGYCKEISMESELFEYAKGIFWTTHIVRCQYHIFPEPLTVDKSLRLFLRAQDLMKNLNGSNSRSEFKLLSLMSKWFLKEVIKSEDCQCDGIAPAALVYLAALYSASSENHIVIGLCSAVLAYHKSQIENETLNAGCLFFVDDVARIVGFSLLCKVFKEKKLFVRRHIDLDLRLTANVIAYYLAVISAERISKQFEFTSYLPTSVFPFDHLLLASAKQKFDLLGWSKSRTCLKTSRRCVYLRMDSVISNATLSSANPMLFTEQLIAYLTEYALENLTSFYDVICKEYNIQCNTADCYRALYFYKCRQYDEVMDLCERILQEPELQSDLKTFAFVNVLLMPPFDSFFDRDVQSLVGLQTLLYFLSPLHDDLRKFKLAVQFFLESVHFSSLVKHYTVLRHHFVGRHFLARYLKLRCSIDCNYSCKKPLSEFYATKTSLPFEYIIRRLIRQRHGKFIND